MLTRRDILAAGAGAAVAAVIPTQSAHPIITVERNRPRNHGKVYRRLSDLEPQTRAAVLRRYAWCRRREADRGRLYDLSLQAKPGALYRYLHFSWTHMHPYYEWPEWYAEQMERIAWGYRQIERPQMRPRGKYFVLDRESELELFHRGLLGQIIMFSHSRGYSSIDSQGVVAGATYLGGAGASDANDGILVAEGGTGPLATWPELSSRAVAGNYVLGDHIYLRAGANFVVTAEAKWTNGSSVVSGTKTTVEGYPGDSLGGGVDFATNDDTMMLAAGTGPLNLVSANWRFKNFPFTSRRNGISTNNGSDCWGTEFIGLQRIRSGTTTAVGNTATVLTFDDGSHNDSGLIENCDLTDGNEATGGNGGTVYAIHSYITVRNNIGGAPGTSGYFFHFKRQKSSTVLGQTTVENNIFGRTGSGHIVAGWHNVQYGLFQHNCIFAPPTGQGFQGGEDGLHGPDGWAWYRSEFRHNTSRASTAYTGNAGFGPLRIDTPSAFQDGTETVIRDNVFDGQYIWCPGDTTLKTHNIDMDYNLWPTDVDNVAREGDNLYSNLAAWQAETTRFGGAHDLNSQEEDIMWANAFDAYVGSTYALSAMSAGAGAAQDMTDMGADPSLVGNIL